MKIETKYDLGESVWIMYENNPVQLPVFDIRFDNRGVFYGFSTGRSGVVCFPHIVKEECVFKTKQSLIDSL